MRYGRHKVEVGSHVRNSVGARHGTRHSTSFGGSSPPRFGNNNSSSFRSGRSTVTNYARREGWACKRHGRLGRIAVVCVLLAAAYAYLTGKFSFSRYVPIRSQESGVIRSPSSGDEPALATQKFDDRRNAEPAATAAAGAESGTPRMSDPSPSSATPIDGGHTLSDEKSATAASFVADPAANSRINDAMNAAEASGSPVRWHADKLHGYAVPVAADASGCRMVQVSVDETGDSSTPVKLCPAN